VAHTHTAADGHTQPSFKHSHQRNATQGAELLDQVLIPVAEELSLPIAMKLGAHRGVNPSLRTGGVRASLYAVVSLVRLAVWVGGGWGVCRERMDGCAPPAATTNTLIAPTQMNAHKGRRGGGGRGGPAAALRGLPQGTCMYIYSLNLNLQASSHHPPSTIHPTQYPR
jgi:hypothetical protein